MRLAIIGCGAVTEQGHLPAAARLQNVQITLLVDKNRARAEALARQYNVTNVAEDYTQVWDKADAALVALPHHLHAPVSIDLLTHGVHVLVEKPMALSVSECDAMIRAAGRGQAVLAVGLMRRFRWLAKLTKWILDADLLGPLQSFDIQEGSVYNWPVTSDFFFRKETAGGGVLIDTGAHTLDMLLWWLGDVASFDYFDDNYDGVEADCKLHLKMARGVSGVMELSRIRDLRNTAIFRGERASLEIHSYRDQVRLRLVEGASEVVSNVMLDLQDGQHQQSLMDLLSAQLADWVHAIQGGGSPRVSGVEARRSIALIEACYAQRKPLIVPFDAKNASVTVREAGS